MARERDIGIETKFMYELLELAALAPFSEDHQMRHAYCADSCKGTDQCWVVFLWGQASYGEDERHVDVSGPRVVDGLHGKARYVGTNHGIVDCCHAIIGQTGKTLHFARYALGYSDDVICPRINNAERVPQESTDRLLERRPTTNVPRWIIARAENEGHVRLGEAARKYGDQIDVTRSRKQHVGSLVTEVARQCRNGAGGEQPAHIDVTVEPFERVAPALLERNHPHAGVQSDTSALVGGDDHEIDGVPPFSESVDESEGAMLGTAAAKTVDEYGDPHVNHSA